VFSAVPPYLFFLKWRRIRKKCRIKYLDHLGNNIPGRKAGLGE